MRKYFRFDEYKVMLYRLLLVFLFYTLTRLLFVFLNWEQLQIDSVNQLIKYCFYGLRFDTSAILYVNLLFIFFSIIPAFVNTQKSYQKFLAYIYFIPNFIAIAFNFIDMIYYRFTLSRSTSNILESVEHEQNLGRLLGNFLINYWYVFLLYFLCLGLWIFLYSRMKIETEKSVSKRNYVWSSLVFILISGWLIIGGIRGGYGEKSRPINMVDANNMVSNFIHANIILNTPFCIIRTFGVDSYQKLDFMPDEEAEQRVYPIKQYNRNPASKPNIVLLILESFSREYMGAFNQHHKIRDYEGFTPFLDSLSQNSMIFTKAFSNGTRSTHAMSAILAGIPSFSKAFTSSPYPNQNIESLVSILNSLGYDTSFFHGAANGSMGFLGFGNILGMHHYYGMNEFNNPEEFDGVWGIWDEPFLQFTHDVISKKKQPFMATVFTVTSHEPYKVPKKYKGKFPKGQIPMHQVVGYTDFAVKRFFESAQREPWFENTIFIITGDHDNDTYYPAYQSGMNQQTAIPIIIYKPDNSLKGENHEWAQHIDIYPTIMDMIGYQKPFRSWGRSLFGDPNQEPFVINYLDNVYRFASGNYICIFNGEKALGFYDKDDLLLKNNLIGNRNREMDELEIYCKAFLQNYFKRIIDHELGTPENHD